MRSGARQGAGQFGLLGVICSGSAHKLGGPVGTERWIRDGSVTPLIVGGGQGAPPQGHRKHAGVAFAAAVAEKRFDVRDLRDRLEAELEGATIFGRNAERLPNTTCFALTSMSAETLLMGFDLDGIAVSSGSACSSGKVAKSHVLSAMGVAPELAQAAIRVSLGWNSTSEDIDRFIAVWRRLRARHKAKVAA
jgi:cysteine desulfurase